MKKLLWICTLCLYHSAAFALPAQDLPADNRIKILTYAPADVYTIPTKYGYQTSIVFSPNENINTISIGDRSLWQIIPAGNRIFIRPLDDGLSTNMTVITDRHEYTFDIKSVSGSKEKGLYVVQFRYPDALPTAMEPPPPPPPTGAAQPWNAAAPVHIPTLDTQRTQLVNEKYTYSGNDQIAPAQVFDNGRQTMVVYDDLPTPVPQPFTSGGGGSDVLVAHKIIGNQLVLDTVLPGFTLKSPLGNIAVYNDHF